MKGDVKKIIDMVRKEIPDKEIMRELGIQTKASLKKMYYDALVEAGRIKDIMTERKVKKAKEPRKRLVTIGKRGTILLSKPLLVEQLGFKEGDKFTVAKRKDSIILKKS
jgi:ribosomal protein L17